MSSSHHITPARGSDRAPTLEHALVKDVMRPGIISCGPETELSEVARLMATNHVHAVVVSGIEQTASGEHLTWGLVSALDLAASTLPGAAVADAGALASSEVVTVDVAEPLDRAVQLMAEHQLNHLIVADGARPVGVISTLDVAGCVAWGET